VRLIHKFNPEDQDIFQVYSDKSKSGIFIGYVGFTSTDTYCYTLHSPADAKMGLPFKGIKKFFFNRYFFQLIKTISRHEAMFVIPQIAECGLIRYLIIFKMLLQIFRFMKKCLANDSLSKNVYDVWQSLQHRTGKLTSTFTALIDIF
jgi:hypothetical protein